MKYKSKDKKTKVRYIVRKHLSSEEDINTYIEDNIHNMKDVKEFLKILALAAIEGRQ